MKTIAVFICDVYQTYQVNVTKNIQTFAAEHDITVHVFANFVAPGNTVFHVQGERSIISLPDLSRYDGILVAGDTFKMFGMQGELMKRIRTEANCPVVSIREKENDLISVAIDNTKAMYDMTNHFIYKHGFKNICFVTGRMEMRDAQERLDGYQKAMEEANLRVSDDMIYFGDYWKNRGKEIVDYFVDGKRELPEAIICSNDYMAISVCNELKQRGLRIPEDICVSGMDDLPESQTYDPQLTSIEVPLDSMVIRSMEELCKAMSNEDYDSGEVFVETRQYYRASCGCNDCAHISMSDVFDDLSRQKDIAKYCVYLSTDYENVLNERECIEQTGKMSKDYDLKQFFVCLCEPDQRDADGHKVRRGKPFSDTMLLKHYYNEEGESVYLENKPFPREQLLPEEYWEQLEGQISFFIPIHVRNEVYGYAIFILEGDLRNSVDARLEYLCLKVASSLNAINMYEELFSMRDIKELYLQDPLTNIYNRRGMQRGFSLIHKASDEDWQLLLVSIDMDGLKYINDNFGHEKGDDAIVMVADCIRNSITSHEFCARLGGDEFVAVLINDSPNRYETFVDAVYDKLKQVNDGIEEDFYVDVSMGKCNVRNQNNLMDAMREADRCMYIEKNKKPNRQCGRKTE